MACGSCLATGLAAVCAAVCGAEGDCAEVVGGATRSAGGQDLVRVSTMPYSPDSMNYI